MTESLFVYGTLMDPSIQQRVFGRIVSGEADSLDDYRKDFIYLGSNVYPIIRPKAGSSVKGAVIKITLPELVQIDCYEGAAYQRKRVTLISGRMAWVYVEP